MAYEPTTWKDGEGGKTPITAERLNKLEQGVAAKAEAGPEGPAGPEGKASTVAGPAGPEGKAGTAGKAGADGKDLTAELAALADRVTALEP